MDSSKVPGSVSLLCILFLFAIYLPVFSGSKFTIDDSLLIQIPQITSNLDLQNLKTIFTPGNHIDFYPLRDLTYWFEVHILGADVTGNNMSVFRFFSFFIFFLILFFSGRILYRRMETKMGLIISILIYGLLPFHSEVLLWASAQKDLLAILFFAIAWDQTEICLKNSSLKSTVCMSSALISFQLALMCKTSFSLVAFILPFAVYFGQAGSSPKLRAKSLSFAMICAAMSAFWSFLQSQIYSYVNDMRLHYSLTYRIGASAAGFGKELAGILIPSFNVMDLENYGSWLSQNRIFIPIGVSAWVVFSSLVVLSIWKKSTVQLLVLLTGFLIYLPTAGLIFPHRNFYSVRYLEPLLFFFWLASSPFLEGWLMQNLSPLRRQIMFTIIVLLLLLGSFDEAKHWGRNEDVFLKAFRMHPESLMIQRQLATAYEEDKRWGRLSKSELDQLAGIQSNLYSHCLGDKSEPLNWDCASYWNAKFLSPGEISEGDRKKASERMMNFVKTFLPERVGRMEAKRRIYELSSGVPVTGAFDDKDDIISSELSALPAGRVRILAAQCFLQHRAYSRTLKAEYFRAHLIDPVSMTREAPLIIQQAVKRGLKGQQLSDFKTCLMSS